MVEPEESPTTSKFESRFKKLPFDSAGCCEKEDKNTEECDSSAAADNKFSTSSASGNSKNKLNTSANDPEEPQQRQPSPPTNDQQNVECEDGESPCNVNSPSPTRKQMNTDNSLCQYISEPQPSTPNRAAQSSRGSSYRANHRVVPLASNAFFQRQQSNDNNCMVNYSPPMPFVMAAGGMQGVHTALMAKVKGHFRPLYKLQMFRFIEIATKRLLFHLAKAAAQHKIFFTVFPLLLVSLSFMGPWHYRDKLFSFNSTPFNSFLTTGSDPTSTAGHATAPAAGYHLSTSSVANHLQYYSNFNGSNPTFDAAKRTSQAEFSVLLSMKSRYSTVLTNRTLTAFGRLLEQIHGIRVAQSQVNFEWTDMCREQCSTSPAFSATANQNSQLGIISALRSNALLLKYPEAIWLKSGSGDVLLDSKQDSQHILLNATRHPRLFIANLLGDVELDTDGIITRARSLLLNIKLKESLSSQTLAAFEESLRALVNNFTANQVQQPATATTPEDFILNFWSVRAYVREVIACLKNIHFKLIFCFVALVVFCIAASFIGDSYQSRPFVGLQIGLVLALSCVSAYCVQLSAASGQWSTAVWPTPFLLCSIGVLLLSSVQQCWQRYSLVALHPVEKLAFIYSWDMPQFALSLLVLIGCSVGGGLASPTPYLQQTLFTMASGLTCLLILVLLYLTVCWFNSARREAAGLKWFQCCRKGDETFNTKYVLDFDELTSAKLHEKLADLKPCLSRSLGKLAANYNLRTLAVALCTIYLIFSLLGAWSEEFFVPSSSQLKSAAYLRKFHMAFEKYEQYLELVIEAPAFDYYDRRNKELVFGLLKWALEKEYATKAVSWLTDFERFQKSTIYDINPDTLVPVLSYVFLKTDHYQKYSTDIVFDKFQTQIVRSRMYLELSAKGLAKSESLVKQLLQKARSANLPLSIKAPYSFSLHHDLQTMPSILWTWCVMLAVMTVACFVLFSHPSVCLVVPYPLCLCPLECWAWPTTCLSPACGHSEYSLASKLVHSSRHLALLLHVQQLWPYPTDQHPKVQYAFQCTLRPTLLGSLSLVLLYCPLLLSESVPVVWQVWKVLMSTAALTLLHYLLVLPSLLIILSDYLTSCCVAASRMCDEQGACCSVEQPAESIYFVPSSREQRPMLTNSMAGSCYLNCNYLLPPAYERRVMGVPPALPLPPPPPLQEGEYGSQQHSNPGSRRKVGGTDNRYHIHEATDSNCDSMDSRGPRQSRGGGALQQQNQQAPSSTTAEERQIASPAVRRPEQIYEEPESPGGPVSRHMPSSSFTARPMNGSRAHYQQRSPASNHKRVDVQHGLMHPNWRQYLLEGNAMGGGSAPVQQPATTPYVVSSPSSHRRYHYKF
uniref:Uncharacterized protein n=1 Tax=Ditylenchus dipsaci TaxID=166011 RepID=A0A915D110_9BILA